MRSQLTDPVDAVDLNGLRACLGLRRIAITESAYQTKGSRPVINVERVVSVGKRPVQIHVHFARLPIHCIGADTPTVVAAKSHPRRNESHFDLGFQCRDVAYPADRRWRDQGSRRETLEAGNARTKHSCICSSARRVNLYCCRCLRSAGSAGCTACTTRFGFLRFWTDPKYIETCS
jgi:hypothetical protein